MTTTYFGDREARGSTCLQCSKVLPESKTNKILHLPSKSDLPKYLPVCLPQMQDKSILAYINEKVEIILNGILT